jgi:hypothetical protein
MLIIREYLSCGVTHLRVVVKVRGPNGAEQAKSRLDHVTLEIFHSNVKLRSATRAFCMVSFTTCVGVAIPSLNLLMLCT